MGILLGIFGLIGLVVGGFAVAGAVSNTVQDAQKREPEQENPFKTIADAVQATMAAVANQAALDEIYKGGTAVVTGRTRGDSEAKGLHDGPPPSNPNAYTGPQDPTKVFTPEGVPIKYRPNNSSVTHLTITRAAPVIKDNNGSQDYLIAYKPDGTVGLDVLSKADCAIFKIKNIQGPALTLKSAIIKGRPIVRISNDKGQLIEHYIDANDAVLNGEKMFEIGNNAMESKTQIEKIADFWLKFYKNKKHLYTINLYGTCHYYCLGDWWTLQIGASGYNEYIDSTVEVVNINISKSAGSLGTTAIQFREVEESWDKTNSFFAKMLMDGVVTRKSARNTALTVAAYDYGKADADVYCDGDV